MYRFLLTRRWLGLLVFVVIFGSVCFQLGMWQFHKLGDRLDRNDVISAHFDTAPVPLTDVYAEAAQIDDVNEWTQVTATGAYDIEHEVTVTFTTRRSTPGVDVVTPLVLESGEAILVNRGWMETANTSDRVDVPPPPSGPVTITGWLRQNNGAGGQAVRPNDGKMRAVSSDGFAESVPYPLLDGYLNLQDQAPESTEPLETEPEPELGQGPHFFYGLQWWFFGLIGITGYVWFARSEAKDRAAGQASATKSA